MTKAYILDCGNGQRPGPYQGSDRGLQLGSALHMLASPTGRLVGRPGPAYQRVPKRRFTTKFNERFPVAHFTKQQIQEKEKELIANYKALKGAKGESGNGWNESLCMILAEPKIWKKLIKLMLRTNYTFLLHSIESSESSKVSQKAISPLLPIGSIATGNLNFTSIHQKDPLVVAPVVSPTVVPTVAPAERSISEQSLHNDLRNFGNNPFASSFDGQETSSACNEQNEAQSAPSEGGSGRKRKQSHIGSALEDYVEFKKSQTSKTLEALNEKKKREEEFSIEKCADQVDSMNELTNEETSYAMELFESDRNREVYMKTKNRDVRLIWLKRKIRITFGTDVEGQCSGEAYGNL
ncbi:hypothetical protein GQ55_1G165400 [Panicum hallii var. hallii]|uniref:Myb/SANT-like domain-containing protein n=1 Tax=Panicum hallii var. hallii TaxID=1504633 RepID=A0A2T7F5N5_9POAL|nr:hypothetical protein GQ55_1G165400 [Panicum hallii var. hallii]